jgi:hypothetical protein
VTIRADTLVEVTVDDRAALDDCLNAAVNRIIEVALRHGRHGILVTRLRDGHFTVGLSDAVPFGYTEQRDERKKPL